MKTCATVLFPVFLALAQNASAGYGSENPRLERLYGSFIAPCCWHENLTLHESPIAFELRARISALVQAGRTDDEIKSTFVREYGTQILALPEGSKRLWLFWTPPLAGAAGFTMLVLLLRRMRAKANIPAWVGLPPAELDDNWDAS